MTVELTLKRILLAILLGTLVGPLYVLKDVSVDNLMDLDYWLEMLAGTIRAFAAVAIAGVGLLSGMFNLPVLRKPPEPAPPEP